MTDAAAPQFSATDGIDGGELRLPRPPGVIRRFWARHRVAADTILAVAVGLMAVIGAMQAVSRSGEASWLTAVTIMLVAVGVTGVYVRRTRPLMTVVAGSAPIIALLWAPADTVLVPAVVAVYSVAAYRSARSGSIAAGAVWGAATVTVAIGTLVLRSEVFGPDGRADLSAGTAVLAFATQFGILTALALAIGINIGNRRRYLAAVIERARQLAVERDQRGQLATAAERARIAREMHDIVSHSLTVMVALAEGSAVAAAPSAPDAATAMRTVAETGRGAMIDMRRMLGVLGGADTVETDIAPQPGFADIPALIDRFRALKMPVVFRGKGPQPDDPAVQLAVYRLVQESLTNALRHAHGPTQVLVSVTVEDGVLRASITDNGLAGFGTATRPSPAGSGRGLIGLRERLATVGGTVTAGPRTDGSGWAVHATMVLDDGTGGGST